MLSDVEQYNALQTLTRYGMPVSVFGIVHGLPPVPPNAGTKNFGNPERYQSTTIVRIHQCDIYIMSEEGKLALNLHSPLLESSMAFDLPAHRVSLCVSIALVSIYALRIVKSYRKGKLPPGPKGVPFFGNLFQLSLMPWKQFEVWKKQYGAFTTHSFDVFEADFCSQYRTLGIPYGGRPRNPRPQYASGCG